MKIKYAAAILLCAVLITLTAVLIINKEPGSPSEIISSSSSESSSESKSEAESAPQNPAINLPLYDGVFGFLSSGDSYYTPDKSHAVTDPERTVVYYNNILVAFTEGELSEDERNAVSGSIGGETVGIISGAIDAIQIRVNDTNLSGLEELSKKLMENEKILYACPEYPVQIMRSETESNPFATEENDDILGDEANPGGNDWWAEAIGAYSAWENSDLCGEIRIGIVDNGFAPEHEDFGDNIEIITPAETNTPGDHGTLVAGIIGAADNDVGIRGIADFAKLYCADLWPDESPDSYHTMTEYLAVINFMAENGIRIINNSWGCVVPSETNWELSKYGKAEGTHSEEYSKWIDKRVNQDLIPTAEFCIALQSQLISSGYDILFIQAAGNGFDNGGKAINSRFTGFFAGITETVYNGMEPSFLRKLNALGITYKSIDEHILIVGSVSNERNANGDYFMSVFSNYGETVDICAPGGNVYSTLMNGYGSFNGTSLASPMVTGSAAFIWSMDPDLTAPEVREILLESAVFRAFGYSESSGWDYPMLHLASAVGKVLRNK